MACLVDNEIYPETSPLAINNYALGYQDFFGFNGGRSAKPSPIAPENENYMRGWFSARMAELERNSTERVNPIFARNRAIQSKAKALEKEWIEYAKSRGWRYDHYPL